MRNVVQRLRSLGGPASGVAGLQEAATFDPTTTPDVDEQVKKQMATGEYASEDDVLREALRSLNEQREDWNAIQTGLKTLDEGNPGVSLDDAFRQVRERNNIS